VTARPALPAMLAETRIVAIVRRYAPATAVALVGAFVSGGVRVVECTVDSEGVFSTIERLRSRFPDVAVGAGTVLSLESARQALDAGATFLVTTHTDPRLVAFAAEEGVPILAGAATASEAVLAWREGAAAVKLFPAGPLGPATLRALREPLPHIDFVAVGGVSAGNAPEFLEAGAVAVGIASWLTAGGDISLAASRAHELVVGLARPDGGAVAGA